MQEHILEKKTGIKWSKLSKAEWFSLTGTDVWDMSVTTMQ